MLVRTAWLAALLAAGGASSELKAINGPCDAAAKLEEAQRQQPRAFADLSGSVRPGPGDTGGKWRSFKSAADLKAYAEKAGPPNTQASMWTAPGGTAIAEVRFQSEAGDWADTVEYCFRPDGTLARVDALLENITAEVTVHRTTHYGAGGAQLSTHARATDWEGKRLKKADTSGKVPVYPTLASLPFVAQGKAAPLMPETKPAGPVAVLDQAGVERFVKSRLASVRNCYERGLAAKPALAGRLDALWTIDGAGATRDFSWVRDELHDVGVAGCIERLVGTWRFSPAPAGPTKVTYPFIFQPRSDAGSN
jgi:hypothetical protein